jgi:hypothetical protein
MSIIKTQLQKMAKKKSNPVKKKSTQINSAADLILTSGSSLEIETQPPAPTWRGGRAILPYLLAQVTETVPLLQPGQAFLVPIGNKGSVRKHLTQNWPTKTFVINGIPGNDKQLRVYFIRDLKPKKGL